MSRRHNVCGGAKMLAGLMHPLIDPKHPNLTLEAELALDVLPKQGKVVELPRLFKGRLHPNYLRPCRRSNETTST